MNGTITRTSSVSIPLKGKSPPVADLIMKNYWPLAFETLFPPLLVSVAPEADFSRLCYNKCIKSPVARNLAGDASSNSSAPCIDSQTLFPGLLVNDPSVLSATDSNAPSTQDPVCSLTWRDPMPDILTKLQSLAFRVTVDMVTSDLPAFATQRDTWRQPVAITGHRTVQTYHTSFPLLVLGVLLSVTGVAAILPLYYGFWELGRKVSMDPLEIAQAFRAPLFEGLNGNATPELMCVERGGMGVRYGVVERFGEGKCLSVEESRAIVRGPYEGELCG